MPRRLTNVSGEVRTLQDSSGRWHVVEPDSVYVPDERDKRDFDQPGVWAEVLAPTKSKATTTKEAS